ncbi:MAG: hypothetical protein JZU58_02965 [Curvibacter lanceolatus]|uniref:hypothetical protein n=1 Tax=Curvibacter lanceolatus TaxID=86182 RepID=UPI00235287DB|nr:hypothetical protein [Curvibacter lanceolatus]MBV5291285.1 hypothetical protein [Curvibacter lanceolatus]
MNQTDVMLRIVDMEAVGGAASPEDAISFIAELINRPDPFSDSYESDVYALLRVGACVWAMRKQRP